MNPFTALQLMNKTTPTVYYDTNIGTMKYSLVPVATTLGHDAYDVAMPKVASPLRSKDLPCAKKNKNNVDKACHTGINNKNVKPKQPRKQVEYPDEVRCCFVKADGSKPTN